LNPDLSMVRSLRKVLESAKEGKGMSRSVVEELRNYPPLGSDASRMLLLGYPLRASLRPMVELASGESALLASLIVASPRSSAQLVGRSGETLAGTLERWVKVREGRRLEQRVLRFRSLVTSGVLGAVTSMVASLGPLIGRLNFTGSSVPADPTTLLVGAAVMAALGSAVLGLFMSGKGFVANLAVTLGVFAIVSSVASPLAAVPTVALWGVK